MKRTFHVQHLTPAPPQVRVSRSPAGIRLQVLLTGLAAHVVRWCRPWLTDRAAEPSPRLKNTLRGPNQLVRVAANSPALVQRTSAGLAVRFAPVSALPDAILFLQGVRAFQLPLRFHDPYKISSDATKQAVNAHSLC
jgi:hypothetical protein